MAEQSGQDLLLQVLTIVTETRAGLTNLRGDVSSLQGDVSNLRSDVSNLRGEMRSGFEAVNNRIDGTNETLRLVASVVHQSVATTKERIDDHEQRMERLETAVARLSDR